MSHFIAAKPDCPACANMEKTLLEARDELVDFLGAWVVMSSQSHLMRLYSPNPEPALVFFRHGTPLLYDGILIILDMFDISIVFEKNINIIIFYRASRRRTHNTNF